MATERILWWAYRKQGAGVNPLDVQYLGQVRADTEQAAWTAAARRWGDSCGPWDRITVERAAS